MVAYRPGFAMKTALRACGLMAVAGLLLCFAIPASAQSVPDLGPAPAQTITVTQEDNGQAYEINVGDGVMVQMGTDLDWSVDPEPPGILQPVPGVSTLARGVQAIYVASQAGTVTITANGRPNCPPGQACPNFIVQVQVTITVDDGPLAPIVGCFNTGDPPHRVCA